MLWYRKLIFFPVSLILLTSVFVFTSCSSTKNEFRQRIRIPFNIQVYQLDPRKVDHRCSSHIIAMLYEGLTRIDESGEIELGQAASYEVDATQTKYIFHLHKTKWSDGEPLTAHDFEYAWKTALLPKHTSNNIRYLFLLKNARDFFNGKVSIDEVGVRALDDYTLQLTLERPAPFIFEALAQNVFKPISKVREERDRNWAQEINKRLPVNGPFRVREKFHGMGFLFEKNPEYWDAKKIRLQELELIYVPESFAQAYMYNRGEIDWIGGSFTSFDEELLTLILPKKDYEMRASSTLLSIQVNMENEFLANPTIRKAISLSIDRDGINKHLFQSKTTSTDTFLPLYSMGKEGKKVWTTEEIRALFDKGLAELGYNRKNLPKISILAFPTRQNKKIVDFLKQNLHDKLGIDLIVELREWTILFNAVVSGEYQLALIKWLPSLKDPTDILNTFTETDFLKNSSRWKNERFSAGVIAAMHMTDLQKRKRLIESLNKTISEELPAIPICFLSTEYFSKKNIRGVVITETGKIDFRYAYIEE